eukprot:10478124-Alexandrium_andersonii.AAC.1
MKVSAHRRESKPPALSIPEPTLRRSSSHGRPVHQHVEHGLCLCVRVLGGPHERAAARCSCPWGGGRPRGSRWRGGAG